VATRLNRNSEKDPVASAAPALEVADLSKTFGNQFALRKVSFQLRAGDFLTIFGPNGAGKTTLIRILSTLSKPSSGKAKIGNHSLPTESEEIRRQIGVIAHQTFLYEDLTADENLRFYGKLYSVPNLEDRIESIISEVGLGLRRRDRVRTFSRGMQQRLSIARAMIHDPLFLFLDEPYTGLDQHASEMLSNWLKRVRSSNRTTLMVTHDLERGLDMADRVAVLNSGKIVFDKMRSEIDPKSFRETYYALVGGERQS
jgi:ABC-type multidrug transport system ATPase subunit